MADRARWVFYGAAVLAVADIAATGTSTRRARTRSRSSLVLAICGFAMWRTWRDQTTYV